MKSSFCLKVLTLCLILPKILGMEAGVDNDVIVLTRKPTQIIHIDLQLTMTTAEEKSLHKLTKDLKDKRLNQYQVDKIFSNAAISNWRCTMDFLLTPHESQLSPSPCRINDVLFNAAAFDNQPLVRYLINLSEQQLRPDQWGMNEALWIATIYCKAAMARLLLDRSAGQLCPNKNGISNAYAKAVKCGFTDVADILLPYKNVLEH